MRNLFIIIFVSVLILSCGESKKSDENIESSDQNEKQVERYELNQSNLDKIKPKIIAGKFIDSLVLMNNYVLIKYQDKSGYGNNAIITGCTAQLFYNFPDISDIDFQLNDWWGFYSMKINRTAYSQFWKVDLNSMNDSIWEYFLDGNGDLGMMFDKQDNFNEKFVEFNYKDDDSREKYLGIGKYAKEEVIKEQKIVNKITLSNFNKITDGMRFNSVKNILGNNYKLFASAGKGEYLTETFSWQDGIKTISILFMNKKVKSKSQIGL